MDEMRFAAPCASGLEPLLAEEVAALGAEDVRETRGAVTFSADLTTGYRVCLWSRTASRVLLELAEFACADADELYAGVAAVPWEEHVHPDRTIAVNAVGTTERLANTQFVARRVKDAVVDRLRERTGRRPSVDLDRPDVRLNLRLRRGRATLALDLAGEPLHRRGYRAPGEQGAAPLKETLAAALLLRAGWPVVAARGGALIDPFCGSGTLLIEGALMAADRAPGLLRDHWGFTSWLGHDATAWEDLLAEADDRAEAGGTDLPAIVGSDNDATAVELARACIRRAGLGGCVDVSVRAIGELEPPAGATPGLVVTNPPHGIRLGDAARLEALYGVLGQRLAAGFDGWEAAVFVTDARLARAVGLRSHKRYAFASGALKAYLYLFQIEQENRYQPTGGVRAPHAADAPATGREDGRDPSPSGTDERSPGAEMFANRLRKRYRHLGKWARREGVTCYRVYDADLPEYNVAVDRYEGAGPDEGRRFAHVQEYAPPASVDADRAAERLAEALDVTADVLGVAPGDVVLKVRRRQRGTEQYDRQDERGESVQVAEGDLRFLVNLRDYLDTGLFLDHRPVRALLRDRAAGTRFCNLFAYTGTASVYAAAGGAASTTTVDLSATYIDWAERNLTLNGFVRSEEHRLVRADVLAWVAEEGERIVRGEVDAYDLVFCDPPSFSNSKRMDATFDVQRDHAALLTATAGLLARDGLIVFSTNRRGFALDRAALTGLDAEDITAATIPPDFERNPQVHACFLVRRAVSEGRRA
ncbi:MAG: bifunctional 23S rRNA (guanine(2069)-N(7))-methyltransferase RlmK/23S rRNA (guanine(2445)-N(2))-methyltransferase RlmL [Anaerosomatales bacterium]|nr:bifunctional 23S rRNA (guanine(2069)-N(7))-methyltransferase RlmK/23S rRNA (guanine(2445)-N(2))-methyltransferase RlmL [Anaerosomatales bacterium]